MLEQESCASVCVIFIVKKNVSFSGLTFIFNLYEKLPNVQADVMQPSFKADVVFEILRFC